MGNSSMITLGSARNELLKTPDQYVLRLQGNILNAEKKGVPELNPDEFLHQSLR
jgi:hypothetical protein